VILRPTVIVWMGENFDLYYISRGFLRGFFIYMPGQDINIGIIRKI